MNKHFTVKIVALMAIVSLLAGCKANTQVTAATSTEDKSSVSISSEVSNLGSELSTESSVVVSTENDTVSASSSDDKESITEPENACNSILVMFQNNSQKEVLVAVIDPSSGEQINFDKPIPVGEGLSISFPEWPQNYEFLFVAIYENGRDGQMLNSMKIDVTKVTKVVGIILEGDNAEKYSSVFE